MSLRLVPRSILSNMFLLTVASIIVILQNVEGGYNYPRPGTRLQLSNSIFGSGGQNFAGGILNEYKNLDEKKILYSLPNRDYDFLQPQTNVGNGKYFPNSYNMFPYQNDIFNRFISKPNKVYGPPETGQKHFQQPIVEYLQNSGPQEFNVQPTLHRYVPNLMNANHNVPSYLNLQNSFVKENFGPHLGEHFRKEPLFFNPQSIPNILETNAQNIQPVTPVLNLKNDFSSQITNTPEVKINNPSLKTQNNIAQPIGQNTVPPVVTKHIYFHVPPPDIEETSVKPTLPKKSYKIIFIKVPNQESRNIEELQTAYNKLGPIEDKTLIYVLSNNSEDSQLVPAYKPSEHEVLFVKYNGNQSIGSDENLIDQDDALYKR